MSEEEWYNDLFAKVQENRLDQVDHDFGIMEVIFKDGDQVLQQWVRDSFAEALSLEAGLASFVTVHVT